MLARVFERGLVLLSEGCWGVISRGVETLSCVSRRVIFLPAVFRGVCNPPCDSRGPCQRPFREPRELEGSLSQCWTEDDPLLRGELALGFFPGR